MCENVIGSVCMIFKAVNQLKAAGSFLFLISQTIEGLGKDAHDNVSAVDVKNWGSGSK